MPLKREEFERLLGAVGTKYSAPQAASRPQISQAAYTALLNGELLVGTARLSVVPGADPGAVLSLEPCNLVVSQPVWLPAPAAEASAVRTLPPGATARPPSPLRPRRVRRIRGRRPRPWNGDATTPGRWWRLSTRPESCSSIGPGVRPEMRRASWPSICVFRWRRSISCGCLSVAICGRSRTPRWCPPWRRT